MHHFEQSKYKNAHKRQNTLITSAYPSIAPTKYTDLHAKYKEGDKTSSIVTAYRVSIHPFYVNFHRQMQKKNSACVSAKIAQQA